jgi:hypothetical protein
MCPAIGSVWSSHHNKYPWKVFEVEFGADKEPRIQMGIERALTGAVRYPLEEFLATFYPRLEFTVSGFEVLS